ncbi:alpha/beta fold hydrolase [Konateibacter massiliensis]|uniref:alpha/beta fold hydrolase n=1 Tax=Konateibacter massiliensis TaxID=2002841 RepID=UPI000C159CAF|nr:alpha/beta hydrolase [Konateibacter massiliensis]
MNNYKNPWDKRLADAGVVEKTAYVGEVNFNYAEGPDNGPALLLLHAQLLDWYTYSEALPELSKHFHVFAVDYPGHGKTTYPDDYPMTANQIGNDLANFIESVIQEPAYVTGNSSGGLLTTWLAANKPDLVKAIVLEDPPLFSSEYPEIKQTIAYRSFTTSYNALQTGYHNDFLGYWLESSKTFFTNHVGPFSEPIIAFAVNCYRDANPGEPVEIVYLPPVVREMIRGLNYYDPRFGSAFYEGTWNEGFDHTEALQKIQCPALLVQANFEILDSGILDGAMSQEHADKAVSLIPNVKYMKVDSSHVVNLEHPDEFAKILEDFFLED